MLIWEGLGIKLDKRGTIHQETAAGQARHTKSPCEAAEGGGFIRQGKSRFPEVLKSPKHRRRFQVFWKAGQVSPCEPAVYTLAVSDFWFGSFVTAGHLRRLHAAVCVAGLSCRRFLMNCPSFIHIDAKTFPTEHIT